MTSGSETHTLIYGSERIPYRVNPDARRSSRIAIHVDPDGSVHVDAPQDQPFERVVAAVQRRARWVVKNVQEARERYENVRTRNYESGEQILYLGRRYVLKVTPGDRSGEGAKLRRNRLEVTTGEPTRPKVKVHVDLWYRQRAYEYFNRRVRELSKKLPWVTISPKVQLREMSRQWGSCSPDGKILLNPNLIKAPRDAVDYVVTHELAHLKHHHHGKEFIALLDQHVPDWRQVKRRLDHSVEILMSS